MTNVQGNQRTLRMYKVRTIKDHQRFADFLRSGTWELLPNRYEPARKLIPRLYRRRSPERKWYLRANEGNENEWNQEFGQWIYFIHFS